MSAPSVSRVYRASKSLRAWCEEYHSPRAGRRIFTLPWAPCQIEIMAQLDQRAPWKLNCLAPRGSGKSRIVPLAWPIRQAILDPSCELVVLGSSTMSMAVSKLDEVKREVEANDALRADFGVLPHPEHWKATERVLVKPGQEHLPLAKRRCCMLRAAAPDSKIRGFTFDSKRPDLVICDDSQQDMPASQQQESVYEHWRDNTLGELGHAQTCEVDIGNLASYRTVIGKRHSGDPRYQDWRKLRYQALVDGASYWPERITADELEDKRARNPRLFAAEYQQDPLDPATQVFSGLRTYGPLPRDIREARERWPGCQTWAHVDRASSLRESADATAIAVCGSLGEGRFGLFYVEGRRLSARDLWDWMRNVHSTWCPEKWGFEVNGGYLDTFEMIADYNRRQPAETGRRLNQVYLQLDKVLRKSHENKFRRIEASASYWRDGTYLLGDDDRNARRVLEDYRDGVAHDDEADAIESAMTRARGPSVVPGIVLPAYDARERERDREALPW